MMKGRAIALAGVLSSILGLTGCANADSAPVTSALSSAPGIQGAKIVISHPGAPWNTEALITIFVADESSEGVEASVRSAARVLADGPLGKQNVTFWVVPGKPSDYGSAEEVSAAHLSDLNDVARDLGLKHTDLGDQLWLTSGDVDRIAGEQ